VHAYIALKCVGCEEEHGILSKETFGALYQ